MSVCFYNSLPNGEYSNLLIAVACSNKSFSCEIFLSVKIHIYQHFLMIKQKSYVFDCLNHIGLCFARFCYDYFNFSLTFYKWFFLNLNGLSDDKVVLFTKNANGFLV